MPGEVPQDDLDPGTPEEVVITLSPREPQFQADLGIKVDVTPDGTPRNRLVTIGDSLTHGFQSGAIFHTDLSYLSNSRTSFR